MTGVTLYLTTSDAASTCYSWTGSITLHTDVPTWRVSVDATYSEAGKGGVRLVGTFSGDV